MRTNNISGLGCFGFAVLGIFSLVFSAIANGFVLSKLWEWFVAPTFEAPMLSIPIAIGISMLIAMVTYQSGESDSKKYNDKTLTELAIQMVVVAISKPFFVLAYGWLVYQFV